MASTPVEAYYIVVAGNDKAHPFTWRDYIWRGERYCESMEEAYALAAKLKLEGHTLRRIDRSKNPIQQGWVTIKDFRE